MINFQKLKDEYNDISDQLSLPEVIQDRQKYQDLTKRFSFLEKILALCDQRNNLIKEKDHLNDILANPKEDQEVRDLAQEELPQIEEKLHRLDEEIEDKLFEQDQGDHDLIIEIRAAAGGEESALFAANLFKMYSRYAENNGWVVEVLGSNQTEIGGYKEISFSVRGQGAYAHLKFESGVHRVQRVPTTESSGRIHTSTVTVAVLIEPKEVDLKINQEDLKIDTYRASGAGGQHVNVTDSAVRITHTPTGTVVACQDERSQMKNKAKAMRILKAKILEKIEQEEASKISASRRVQVGTGERSEKIRTYNYPERRVTDHRINFTIYRLEAVLEGDLSEVVKNLIKAERQKRYESEGLV